MRILQHSFPHLRERCACALNSSCDTHSASFQYSPMNIPRTALLFITTAFLVCALHAAEGEAPALSISKAAKLAEDAIAAAALPADCYVRAISLQQRAGVDPYYSVIYKPNSFARPKPAEGESAPAATSASIDVLRITMDGKVTSRSWG